MPSMMTDDQDPCGITGDTEKKMVREALEVHPAQIAVADGK